MDCETCNDLLLDLAYGELDELRAAAVKKHCEGCPGCKTTEARYGRTRAVAKELPMMEAPAPTATLLAAIRHAAEANQAAAAAEGAVAPVIPLDEARLRAKTPGWLRRVGEVAMRRQVAMAAVFFLMVGVGIRFLPSSGGVSSPTAVDLSPPEVVPATDLPALQGETPAVPTPQAPIVQRAQRLPTPAAAPTPALAHRERSRVASSAAGSARDNGGSLELDGAANNRATAYGARAPGASAETAPPPAVQTPSPVQAAAPEPGWRQLQQNAETQRANGQLDQAIVSLQQALDAAPPGESRRAIARSLHADLLRAGRVREAADVQANHLTPASDVTGLGAAVGQASSAPHATTNRPSEASAPSSYRPSSARPARRSLNMQNDAINSVAY